MGCPNIGNRFTCYFYKAETLVNISNNYRSYNLFLMKSIESIVLGSFFDKNALYMVDRSNKPENLKIVLLYNAFTYSSTRRI